MDKLDDVWTSRDLPVLIAVVRRMEELPGSTVNKEQVMEDIGLAGGDVVRAGLNLARAGLVSVAGSKQSPVMRFTDCSTDALRTVGLWPDAGNAFDRLMWALEQRIAEAAHEERGRLAQLRDPIVSVGRDLGVEVLGAALTGRLPA